MSAHSIAGINVKIGANTSELAGELGKVGSTVESSLSGAESSVKTLSDRFDDVKKSVSKIDWNMVANAVVQIGGAMKDFSKGVLEEAIKIDPATAESVQNVKDAFGELKTTFVESLLPTINDLAPKLAETLNDISAWVEEHPNAAKGITLIAGSLGLLAAVLGPTIPIIVAFSSAIGGISASTALAAGGIVGLIALVGLLVAAVYDAEQGMGSLNDAASETFSLTNGDTGGAGPLWDPAGDPTMAPGAFDPSVKQEELGETVSATTEAIEEQGAVVETTNSLEQQAAEIYENMKTSVEGFGTAISDTDLTGAMSQLNDVLSSETYQMFTSEPISEEINGSWATFGTNINTVNGGLQTLDQQIGDGTAASVIESMGGSASAAAGGFDTLTVAIYGVIDAYKALQALNFKGAGGTGSSTDLFRASGGPVTAGEPYIIGELGPEVFVPSVSGHIVPNDELGGSKTQTNNYNFNGPIFGENYLKSYVENTVRGVIRRELRVGA